jgi:hypothetical protein
MPNGFLLKGKMFPFLKKAKLFGFSDLDIGSESGRRWSEGGGWRLESSLVCARTICTAGFWELCEDARCLIKLKQGWRERFWREERE